MCAGVTGASIRIDDNGDSEGNYTVLAVKFSNVSRSISVSKTSHTSFHCHYEMVPVGRFDYSTKNGPPVMQFLDPARPTFLYNPLNFGIKQQFNLTDKISWVGGKPPWDEPPCGYRNEKCQTSDNRDRDSQIAAGVLGFVLLVAAVSSIFFYRKWKVEQEIDGLVWKIDPNEIISHLPADGFMDKSTSKVIVYTLYLPTQTSHTHGCFLR